MYCTVEEKAAFSFSNGDNEKEFSSRFSSCFSLHRNADFFVMESRTDDLPR